MQKQMKSYCNFGKVDWSCSCCMNTIMYSGVFLISAFFISPSKWTHSLTNDSSRSFLYKDWSLLAHSMTVADGMVDCSLRITKFSATESWHFSFYASQILISRVMYKICPTWTFLLHEEQLQTHCFYQPAVYLLFFWHLINDWQFILKCFFAHFLYLSNAQANSKQD